MVAHQLARTIETPVQPAQRKIKPKRNRPLQSLSLKRPALAVALLDLPPQFRGSAIGGDAFSAERPVLAFCGNFEGVASPKSRGADHLLIIAAFWQRACISRAKKSRPVSSELLFGMTQSLEMAANNATKPFG
jgi:hypothetical protein